jgi:hypothetical protein
VRRRGTADLARAPQPVRRRVVRLIERGCICRSEEGTLYLTKDVGDGFEDMTARLVEELLTTAQRLEARLANRPTRLGPLRPG